MRTCAICAARIIQNWKSAVISSGHALLLGNKIDANRWNFETCGAICGLLFTYKRHCYFKNSAKESFMLSPAVKRQISNSGISIIRWREYGGHRGTQGGGSNRVSDEGYMRCTLWWIQDYFWNSKLSFVVILFHSWLTHKRTTEPSTNAQCARPVHIGCGWQTRHAYS